MRGLPLSTFGTKLVGQQKTAALAVAVAAITLLLLVGAWAWQKPDDVRLAGFEQRLGQISITLDPPANDARISILSHVPLSPDLRSIHGNSRRIEPTGGRIQIGLGREPKGHYSVFVFSGEKWVELVRQPGHWLAEMFGFDKPDGYTILGRRTISVTGEGPAKFDAPIFTDRPSLSVEPFGTSLYAEVRVAHGLLHYLWQQPLKQGPTAVNHSEFASLPFDEKMRRLRDGEFSVMCQGFRDVFLHAASGVSGLKARAVSGFNYYPHMGGLISYSHATAEIWVEALRKWVLFDPWLAIMVTDPDGIPVGASELKQRRQDLRVTPLLSSLPRFYRRADGTVTRSVFYPSSVELARFSCDSLGCAPGFLDYFRSTAFAGGD